MMARGVSPLGGLPRQQGVFKPISGEKGTHFERYSLGPRVFIKSLNIVGAKYTLNCEFDECHLFNFIFLDLIPDRARPTSMSIGR